MVKQQMYLPLHGGPPVPIRGTPPRKAKAPRPRQSMVAVAPPLPTALPPSSGMARRSTIATPTVSVTTRRSTIVTPVVSVNTRRTSTPPAIVADAKPAVAAKPAASAPGPKKSTTTPAPRAQPAAPVASVPAPKKPAASPAAPLAAIVPEPKKAAASPALVIQPVAPVANDPQQQNVTPSPAVPVASDPEPKNAIAPPAPVPAPTVTFTSPPLPTVAAAAATLSVDALIVGEEPGIQVTTLPPPPPPGKKKRWNKHEKLPPAAMEPYDGLTSRVLRDECKRRGISLWSEKHQHLRHKLGFIQLLREDDQRRAAQQASAQIHKQDLEQIQLGSFAAMNPASESKFPASPRTSNSFLSPNASTLTPASAAAATAAVLYPPTVLMHPPRPHPSLASPLASPAAKPSNGLLFPSPPPAAASVAAKSKSKIESKPFTSSLLSSKPRNSTKGYKKKAKGKGPHTPPRSVRARRSCYIRLINVLLTPEFNTRWKEMNDKIADSDTTADVNQFWLDVHVAFMSVNQLFDGLHFHDALFSTVDPSVILAHEATRLRQMWNEVVKLYQVAVAKSKQPSQAEDETQSFFDSCAKRVDVLYLHMGLLLEPELSEFVLKMVPSTASQRSPPVKVKKMPAAAAGQKQKNGAAASVDVNSRAGLKATAEKRWSSVSPNKAGTKRPASSQSSKPATAAKARTPSPKQKATTTTPSQSANPFSPIRPGALDAAFEAEQEQEQEHDFGGEQSYALVVSGELRDSAFETFAPHSLHDDDYGSSDYDRELPTRAMTPRKRRRRSEMSTDIVELHSSSLRGNELVAHSGNGNGNRMHHSALTTRASAHQQSSELMLPPDEWVILENRLRKVSESLDRCHRALSGGEDQISESHRMSLESDLRFYSAIKQRLQEQLLMVMQGF